MISYEDILVHAVVYLCLDLLCSIVSITFHSSLPHVDGCSVISHEIRVHTCMCVDVCLGTGTRSLVWMLCGVEGASGSAGADCT